MKVSYIAAAVVVAGSLAVSATFAQSASSAPAGGMQLAEFKPGLDDVMTMLVQPRHLKLHAAAEQKNWELAAFQLKELRSSFRRIGQYIPKYHDKAFDEAVVNIMNPTLQQVEDAIKAQDAKKFNAAYAHMTDGCNACHSFMDHAFLVMKVPTETTAALFKDQEFKASK